MLLRGENPKYPLAGKVTEQNAHHPDGKVKFGGQIHDWNRPTAQAQNPAVLGAGPEML